MEKLYIIAGKARSGKDSVATIIQNHYKTKKVIKYPCTIYLKDYIKKIYNINFTQEKPRTLLQTLGKQIKEKYPNFFLDRMKEDINYLSKNCDILIITGIRLKKELEFLKENFSPLLIKVERNIDNNLTEKQKQDITETDVDNYKNFNYIIKNNENLEKLKINIEKILEEV